MSSLFASSQSLRLLARITRYFSAHKGRIGLAAVCMGLVAASTAGTAYLVKPALDDIFIRQDRQALATIPLLFVILITVKGAARFLQNYQMGVSGLRVLEVLRQELYGKVIRLPVTFFEENQVGILMSRIINDIALIRSSLPALIMLVRESLTMVGLVGVVFWQDPFLATWAVVVLPLAFFPFIYFGRKLRTLGRKSQSKIADISSFLQEIFSGIRVVKAFAAESEETRRFDLENDRLVKLAIRQTLLNELSSPVMELVGALGMGLVIWYGGSRVLSGESTPGTFFSFMAGLLMLYDPIKKLTSANNEIQKALAGAERVFEILDSTDILEERGGDVEFTGPFESLRLESVTMRYSGSCGLALDSLDLDIRAGERVAIVGPSGAGKTTLVNLIPRFYEPSDGRILLNGVELGRYTLESIRRSIGMVSQEAFLFNASVAANIAYAQTEPDLERIREAARAAYALDFIEELPEGFATVVGERGVRLSGGQRQRLTIARALYKNPPLLILDEATSALDTESERIVQLALENLMLHRTSFVIAHRLSTILSADRILVMDKGRVVAQGRHAELLGNSPLYAKLYRLQFEDVERQQPPVGAVEGAC